MYDSRSSHARPPQHWSTIGAHLLAQDIRRDDMYFGRHKGKARKTMTDAEAIAEGLLDMQPEVQHVAVLSKRALNRLHAEALREDERRFNEEMDEAWAWLDHQMDQQRAWWEDEDDDEGYPEPWLPALSIAEAREHFGPDWEHNGFHIINTVRRSTTMDMPISRKERNEDHRRAEALIAARKRRQQAERVVAQVCPDAPAKVTRPSAPFYNDTLDPLSPNFDLASWGAQ